MFILYKNLNTTIVLLSQDDIEKIVEEIEKEEKRRLQVKEFTTPPPRRVNFSIAPHPFKDELILFGGEFFNGQKVRFHELIFKTHIVVII